MSLFSALQSLEVPSVVPSAARSPIGAQAGLLYRLGKWDAAHVAVQDLETPEGYFWHGILHRQEEDWSNARYWFRRVGTHPVYRLIHQDAKAISLNAAGDFNIGTEWDPMQMVQWCEVAAKHRGAELGGIDQTSLTELQIAEWRRLFDWCMA